MSVCATVAWVITCNHRAGTMKCAEEIVQRYASSEFFARKFAAKDGWRERRGKDYCPAHAKEAKP